MRHNSYQCLGQTTVIQDYPLLLILYQLQCVPNQAEENVQSVLDVTRDFISSGTFTSSVQSVRLSSTGGASEKLTALMVLTAWCVKSVTDPPPDHGQSREFLLQVVSGGILLQHHSRGTFLLQVVSRGFLLQCHSRGTQKTSSAFQFLLSGVS